MTKAFATQMGPCKQHRLAPGANLIACQVDVSGYYSRLKTAPASTGHAHMDYQGSCVTGQLQRHSATGKFRPAWQHLPIYFDGLHFEMSNSKLHCLQIESIDVRLEPMLRIQGYKNLNAVRPRVRKIAEAMRVLAAEAFSPQVRYVDQRIAGRRAGSIELDNGVIFHSPAFDRFLPECDAVVVFVLTMGADIDEHLQELQANDKLVDAIFLEAAAWLGLETVTKRLSQHLRQRAAKTDASITRRISPGYSFRVDGDICEWTLYEQKQLFDSFDGAPLPVEVLDSCAMLPKMSRSGLYGVKPKHNPQ